jgi:hypothetical protein
MTAKQGEQIGRIFPYRVIAYLGYFFNYLGSVNFGATFSQGKKSLIFAENGLGYFWAIFSFIHKNRYVSRTLPVL